MKRNRKVAIVGLSVLILIAGLGLFASRLPFKMGGAEWRSIEKCVEHQAYLYQSLEGYLQANGKLPDKDFQIRGWPAKDTWKCPACERGYTLHPERYGNPNAVVIADEQDRHPTTLRWWLKGLHPRVQTMGDGTIQLFKDGKLLTMDGSKKRKEKS